MKRGSACSETAWRWRIRRWSPAAVLGEDDSWQRCGAPAVAWLGLEGRGGRGGASGPVREARERQWPRWCLSAATAALGRGWGENQRRERGMGRVGRVRGEREGVRGTRRRSRGVGRSRRWPTCGRGRWPRDPRPSGARRTTTGRASQLGRARWAGPAQVRPRWASLSLSFSDCFLFLLNCNCWALLKILKRFQKS